MDCNYRWAEKRVSEKEIEKGQQSEKKRKRKVKRKKRKNEMKIKWLQQQYAYVGILNISAIIM